MLKTTWGKSLIIISSVLSKGDVLMKRNMSNIDRLIRAIFAVLLVYLYIGGMVTGTFGIILVVLGVILLITSVLGFCPLYALFKISTFKG